MKNDIRWVALTKSMLYVAAAMGISDMLTSNNSIISVVLGVACMISMVFDLNTW